MLCAGHSFGGLALLGKGSAALQVALVVVLQKQFLLKNKKKESTPCRIFRLCLFPLFFSFFLAFFPVDKPPFPRIAQSPPGSRVAMKLEFILYFMFIFGLFLFCFCFLLFFKSFFQVTTYGVSCQKLLTFDVICR